MDETEAGSGSGQPAPEETRKDFFISYTHADQKWARWIAWCLEQEGYSIIYDEWDFPAGSDFVYEMDQALKRAERLVVVLSPSYLRSKFGFSEWAAKFRLDPTGAKRLLVPVRIEPCDDIEGLLGPIVRIDLLGLDEESARQRLLAGVDREGHRPACVPFPVTSVAQKMTQERPAFPGALPALWNVPAPNPLFTGREDLLARLESALRAGQNAALSQPQAISGLGGIGKTQIAIEYAYRHRQDYEAVFWVVARSQDTFIVGFSEIARLLDLPQQNEKEQSIIVQAVQRWLREHDRWLLILDNADDLSLARDFLPSAAPGGHILLTTRAQAMGRLAQKIEVEEMDEEQGALFLLRRADILAPDAPLEQASGQQQVEARALVRELGGLPLALDQAGAYIEETGCGLADYRQLYQKHRRELHRRRGGKVDDHPEPVATTWALSFAKVEEKNRAAADLLRLLAFLAPDAIPEEILTAGSGKLGPPLGPALADDLARNDAIAALLDYSLVRRDSASHVLSLHRLVQAVLKDEMDQPIYQRWAERAVRVVDAAFPGVEFTNWPRCERLLPHALACAELIEQERMTLLEAARLLNQAGYYLVERGRYAEAEALHRRALEIYEQQLGAGHPDTARSLNNLANLYSEQGRYEQAEALYRRALEIYEQQLGAGHPNTVKVRKNYVILLYKMGRIEEAREVEERFRQEGQQADAGEE